jgi:hypothetical protein
MPSKANHDEFHNAAGTGKGTGNNVRAGSGVVKVTDERGKEVSAPQGTGVFVNDKELSHEELGALKEQNPALHEGITKGRQELADRAKSSTGRARKADAVQLDQPDVKPIHTVEAGATLNDMYKRLYAHGAKMRSSSSPRADKLADSPLADVHGKAMQALSDAHGYLTEGDKANRGTRGFVGGRDIIQNDPHYANKQYRAAFSKLKEAHEQFNSIGASAPALKSPIDEDSLKHLSARVSHPSSLQTQKPSKSRGMVVVGNTAHFIGDGGEAAHDPKEVAAARAKGMDVKFLTESEARDQQRTLDARVKQGMPAAGAKKFRTRKTPKVYNKEVREGTRTRTVNYDKGADPKAKTPKNRRPSASPRIHGASMDNTPRFEATSEVGETPQGTSFAPGMANRPIGPSQPPVQGPANKRRR